MNWGDVPAWVALALATGAGWVALLARRDSRTAAGASVRSAVAAEESLALQRAEAEARQAAALPRPAFTLRRTTGDGWILRNEGQGTAVNVFVNAEAAGRSVLDLPFGETFAPGHGHTILVTSAMGERPPTELLLTWDGQGEPVAVPFD